MARRGYRDNSRKLILWSGPALALALLVGPIAWGQDSADDSRTYRFDISAQPLMEALRDFTALTGRQVVVPEGNISSYASAAVVGYYTASDALARLTDRSGFRVTPIDRTTYQLLPADRPDSVQEESIEEIVVVGFRGEQSSTALNVDARLMETPATVNVATSDFVSTVAARRVEEVLQYVPGASSESVNASGSGFNIRGFSTTVFGGVAAGEGSLQIDNYRVAGRRYHFDPVLYDRIEVLKGTASLQYGTADPGGVIRFVTKKPQFDRRHRIEGIIGSYDLARGTIDSTGPIGDSENVAYRLVASVMESNQSFHGNNDDISFDDRMIVNPQLTWLTPGGGELRLSYEYSEHENTFDPGIKRLNDGSFTFNSEPFLGEENLISRETSIGVAEFKQPVSENWEILIGGTIGDSDVSVLTDASFGAPNDENLLGRSTQFTDEDYNQEGFRAQVTGQFYTGSLFRHQLTVGISSFSSDNFAVRDGVFSRTIDVTNPVFGPAPDRTGSRVLSISTKLEEEAVYIQDYISVGDKLKIFGGVRYTDANGASVIPEISRNRPGEDDSLDYTIAVIFNENERLNPFASYSTSLVPQVGQLTDPSQVLPFSTGQQLEIGIKSQWLNGKLSTTTSLFEIEQTDIVEGDPANPGFFILAGDQRTRGFEFEAVGQITDELSVLGGYSYLDAEFTGGRNDGATPHSVPRQKFSLFGQYEFRGELTGLRAGIGFLHVGKRQGNNANTYELPSYERFDAFLGYKHHRFDFRISIENLLDEDYVIGGDASENFAQGPRRFFTLNVGYEFN